MKAAAVALLLLAGQTVSWMDCACGVTCAQRADEHCGPIQPRTPEPC